MRNRLAVGWMVALLLFFTGPTLAETESDGDGKMLRAASLKIVNGETTAAFESTVALLDATTGRSFCSGVLIGCSTVLTAAHCLCGGVGSQCGEGGFAFLTTPEDVQVFAQHGGHFGVESFAVHPDFVFGENADVAILRLSGDVDGVEPSDLGSFDPAPMTPQRHHGLRPHRWRGRRFRPQAHRHGGAGGLRGGARRASPVLELRGAARHSGRRLQYLLRRFRRPALR